MLISFDKEVIESQKPLFINKFQFTSINGAKKWLQITKMPIVGQNGKTSVLSIGVDITDLIEFSEALSKERDLVKSIIEFSPDPIIISDLEGRITDCNKASLDLLKYEEKREIYLTSVYGLVAESEATRALEIRASLYKAGVIKNKEVEMVCKDGDVNFCKSFNKSRKRR